MEICLHISCQLLSNVLLGEVSTVDSSNQFFFFCFALFLL